MAAVTDTQLVTFIVLTNTSKLLLLKSFGKMRKFYSKDDDCLVLLYENAAEHRTKVIKNEVER